MDCIVLGIGATMPLPQRPLSAAAVRHLGRLYLFDAGEGVQVGFKALHLGFKPLAVIAVSHLHADHCLGIPGLLMMRARSDHPGSLTILGPAGIKRLICDLRRDLDFFINYHIHFVEWNQDHEPCSVAYKDQNVLIRWAPLKHTVPCLGYLLEERERPGRFNPGRALALGIPKGPLWAKLQDGQSVTLPQGETVHPQQVLGPTRRGRKIAYITDTLANKNL